MLIRKSKSTFKNNQNFILYTKMHKIAQQKKGGLVQEPPLPRAIE